MGKPMQPNTIIRILICACLLGISSSLSAQPLENTHFNVVDRYIIGGNGRWDLLSFDNKYHRLFISRSTHVQVMSTDTGKLVGDISGTEGVHGIAIADGLNLGFTSNGKSNSVTVFDLTALKIIKTIKTSGKNPDSIIYDRKSRHIFTFNGHSDNASVIDAATYKEIGTISLPGKPELAVTDNAGKVFVNIEDKNEIAVIDTRSNKVLKIYPFANGTEPTGLAIDQEHHRLFSACANGKMEILDSETGKVVSEIDIGSHPDSAAFDTNWGLAFSSNGDGTLTVVKEDDPMHFSVLQNVATQKGARTMAYDPVHHRAYLATASFGEIPPKTDENPKPRPALIPGSFVVLLVSPDGNSIKHNAGN
jgi:YVTN family beta-propeller protein